jgi:hypothetical protein
MGQIILRVVDHLLLMKHYARFLLAVVSMDQVTTSASHVVLNLAVVSLWVGMVSDAAGLRLAFGGSGMPTFVAGIRVCLRCCATSAAICGSARLFSKSMSAANQYPVG